MNRITKNISRLKKTGTARFNEPVKISKEEKAKHLHPRWWHKGAENINKT